MKNQNELVHYGVKGMHWGVRRYDYVPKGKRSKFSSNTSIVYDSNKISSKDARNAVAKYRYDKSTDRVIRRGTILQNMSTTNKRDYAKPFYSSTYRSDNAKYRGLYGQKLRKYGDVYSTKLIVNRNLKVASEDSATAILKSIVSEHPELVNDLYDEFISLPKKGMHHYGQKKLLSEAANKISNGVVDNDVYRAVNLGLTDSSEEGRKIANTFYKGLSKKGYSAIKDVNDSEFSGYASKDPLIIFNNDGKKVTVKRSRRVTYPEMIATSSGLYLAVIPENAVVKGSQVINKMRFSYDIRR